LRALLIICEDCGAELDTPNAGRPIATILPRLVPFLRAPNTRMQQLALACINFCITDVPTVLATCIDSFLEGLFALAGSADSKLIRLAVCEAFVRLSETFIDHLQPHMDGVVQFMIHACLDADDRIALAASEFWTTIASQRQVCQQFVLPHLDTLLRALLRNMAYSEMELAGLLNAARDDASVPDDPRDIRPHFVRIRRGGTGDGGGVGGADADEDDDGGADDGPQEVRCASVRSNHQRAYVGELDVTHVECARAR
jgi:transportin-1